MVPVLADANGVLAVSNYGWIGGANQRNPLSFGFSAAVHRSISNADLAAGNNTIDDTPVPAGEIWIITNIVISYTGTVAGVVINACCISGGGSYNLYEQRPPVSGQWYDRQGWWVLAPGDYLRWGCSGATAGDDGVLRSVGIRVDIDQ